MRGTATCGGVSGCRKRVLSIGRAAARGGLQRARSLRFFALTVTLIFVYLHTVYSLLCTGYRVRDDVVAAVIISMVGLAVAPIIRSSTAVPGNWSPRCRGRCSVHTYVPPVVSRRRCAVSQLPGFGYLTY